MYEFNVVKDGNILRVTSNTYWNCSVYGSLILDKISGNGNSTIMMSIPKEMTETYGRVIFTYGDERCDYPALDIYYSNACYIETDPMFIRENGTNVLKMSYNGNNDSVNIKVFANGSWNVTGAYSTYINDNDLIIIPTPDVCSSTTTISTCNNTTINVELYNKEGGQYSSEPFEYYNKVTGVTAQATSDISFGCSGGRYSADFYTMYDRYGRYAFIDCCNKQHTDDIIERKVGTGTTRITGDSGSFDSWDCCEGPHYETATLPFSYNGFSTSIDFTQRCDDCSNSPQCNHCEINGLDVLKCEGTQQYEIPGVYNANWSISPINDLVSINSDGLLTYKRHTRDITYTIKGTNDFCGDVYKSITIKACTPYYISCVVSSDASLSATRAMDIIFETSKGSITMNSINIPIGNGSSKTREISPTFDGATIERANINCNDGETYRATFSPSTISDGQTYTLLIKNICTTPVQLIVSGSMLAGGYEYFVLSDGSITDANKEAVKVNSQIKLHGAYNTPISLGYFNYDEDCNGSYNNDENYFCHLVANGCEAKTMVPGTNYNLYGYLSGRDMFIKIIVLWFPTYKKCQDDSRYGKYYVTIP